MPLKWLLVFLNTLSTNDPYQLNSDDIRKISDFIGSDGCTGVPDFYLSACIIHDFWYRSHRNFNGFPITKAEADMGFKKLIQKQSFLGVFSPMAQWRWLGVRFFGQKAWD